MVRGNPSSVYVSRRPAITLQALSATAKSAGRRPCGVGLA